MYCVSSSIVEHQTSNIYYISGTVTYWSRYGGIGLGMAAMTGAFGVMTVKCIINPELEAKIDNVEKRIDKVDERLDRVEERIDKVEKRIDMVEERIDRVERKESDISTKLNWLTGYVRAIAGSTIE
jgi:chaperonin cofactor prefoldin